MITIFFIDGEYTINPKLKDINDTTNKEEHTEDKLNKVNHVFRY